MFSRRRCDLIDFISFHPVDIIGLVRSAGKGQIYVFELGIVIDNGKRSASAKKYWNLG